MLRSFEDGRQAFLRLGMVLRVFVIVGFWLMLFSLVFLVYLVVPIAYLVFLPLLVGGYALFRRLG
ncbi:MAG TPA: hypothetical protein VNG11_05230 [Chloroflexota bacterium]|nr:hypothetical protein [Chloroflexota bacterium]